MLTVLELFRGLVLLILWVLEASKFSEYAQYTRSISYSSTVSAPLRLFHPFFWQKPFTDDPTSASWNMLLSWGGTGVLRYFGSIYCECSQYFRVLYCGYSMRPSISGFDTADNLVPAVLLLLILLVLPVFWHSILLYSQYWCHQYCSYSHYAQYEMYSILPSILQVRSTLGASVKSCI